MKSIFRRFLSIRLKMIIPLTISFAIMIFLILGFVGEFLELTANKIFEREINALGGFARNCIDPEKLDQFHHTLIPGSDLKNIQECFNQIKEVNSLARLNSYFLNEDDQLTIGAISGLRFAPGMLIPGKLLDEESMALNFGADISDAPEIEAMLRSGLNEITFQDKYYTHESGELFFVGYLPIPTPGSDLSSGLIIYVAAGEISKDLSNFEFYLSLGVFIAFIVIFVTIFMIATRSTASLRRLNKGAEGAAAGDYQAVRLPDPEYLPDEVSRLTAVFNDMVAKVYSREEQLVEKVTELKIFIDQGRHKEELGQIVDSDFFQDLQKRAKTMRDQQIEE